MHDPEHGRVAVSRLIEAPAATIFRIVTDPASHAALDGSGMVRGAVSKAPITRLGDVFVMRMFFAPLGEYQMDNHVVEFEVDRRIAWAPIAGKGHPDAGRDDLSTAQRWIFELTPSGTGRTLVTEIYDCSRWPESDIAASDGGRIWLPALTATLERLEQLCRDRASRGAVGS